MAEWARRGLGLAALPDSGCGAGNARLAATSLDFCGCDVFERRGSYSLLNSGTHRIAGNIPQAGARILFVSVLVRGFPVADDKTAPHRACRFSIAHQRLGSS